MSKSAIEGRVGGIPVGDGCPVLVMGVINLTGNSFYSASVKKSEKDVIATAKQMVDHGADIIDVGARSTAPYRSSDIPVHTEARLLRSAVRALFRVVKVPISADTTRLEPARDAISEGAKILNDVFGLTQKDSSGIARLVASSNSSFLLTAHESRPLRERDPIKRVSGAISKSRELARKCGVDDEQITIDPGIGFFKDHVISNVEWNCTVLNRLLELRDFGRPICVGVSRKKFIGSLTGDKPSDQRLYGSMSATSIAVYNGAHIIRTHDVAETADAVRIASAIKEKGLSLL